MLDFLFLGLGVWKDGLFSLAVPFFFLVLSFTRLDFSAGSLASMLRGSAFAFWGY